MKVVAWVTSCITCFIPPHAHGFNGDHAPEPRVRLLCMPPPPILPLDGYWESPGQRASFLSHDSLSRTKVTSLKRRAELPDVTIQRKSNQQSLFRTTYRSPTLCEAQITPAHFVSCRVNHMHKVHIPPLRTTSFSNSFFPGSALE